MMPELCPAFPVVPEPHDWRLWKRSPILGEENKGQWPIIGHSEMWYCTRCRKFEDRKAEEQQA